MALLIYNTNLEIVSSVSKDSEKEYHWFMKFQFGTAYYGKCLCHRCHTKGPNPHCLKFGPYDHNAFVGSDHKIHDCNKYDYADHGGIGMCLWSCGCSVCESDNNADQAKFRISEFLIWLK